MINLLTYLSNKLNESGKPIYFEQAPKKDPITNLPPT
ncbi:MAG: hypothetical protein K0S80_3921, partial [Neobacillus sp.]|nr:hypothetical protein [Neobacillus sp.]